MRAVRIVDVVAVVTIVVALQAGSRVSTVVEKWLF